MNTASVPRVRELFELVGADPFKDVKWSGMTHANVKKRVAALVRNRGHIVHKAELPAGYGLTQARNDRKFVGILIAQVDSTVCQHTGL
jgi:hypothetical protein